MAPSLARAVAALKNTLRRNPWPIGTSTILAFKEHGPTHPPDYLLTVQNANVLRLCSECLFTKLFRLNQGNHPQKRGCWQWGHSYTHSHHRRLHISTRTNPLEIPKMAGSTCLPGHGIQQNPSWPTTGGGGREGPAGHWGKRAIWGTLNLTT
jgi:hypothetical protein